MSSHLYFAYGSNMSTQRIQARIERAQPYGRAHWPDMALAFNKPGVDGSGKANLIPRNGARAWGVLFELHDDDWVTLDGYEPGYERSTCGVHIDSGQIVQAQVYLAIPPFSETPPHDWYRDHLLNGAVEHALPDEIVAWLRGIPLLGT